MIRTSSVFSLALLLTYGAASSALGQDDDLEVTMQVLDDLSEIDAVTLDIDDELDDADRADRDREDRPDDRSAGRPVEHEELAGEDRGVDPTEDDEHAEGDLEDHDVEEDLEHEHDTGEDDEEDEGEDDVV